MGDRDECRSRCDRRELSPGAAGTHHARDRTPAVPRLLEIVACTHFGCQAATFAAPASAGPTARTGNPAISGFPVRADENAEAAGRAGWHALSPCQKLGEGRITADAVVWISVHTRCLDGVTVVPRADSGRASGRSNARHTLASRALARGIISSRSVCLLPLVVTTPLRAVQIDLRQVRVAGSEAVS
jgi:hypothetical protein